MEAVARNRETETRSFTLPGDVAEFLSASDNASARLAGIVRRYERIVRESLPRLSRAQWCAIFDANNGTDEDLFSMDAGVAAVGTMLWANVADSRELSEKWEIDQGELVRLMRAWAPAEQVAAWEACRTFWRNHEKDTDEAMRLAGVIGEEK